MSQTSDQMELREEDIRSHYAAALDLLDGFDHAPRIGKAKAEAAPERSVGVGTRRAFRSTTPGLVTRRTARAEGIQLTARIESVEGGEGLITPTQAHVQQGLRRAIAIALAVASQYADRTPLAEMKRSNFATGIADSRMGEFKEYLAAEALITLYTFANATAYLLAPHASETVVEVGEVDEMLTENAQLALHGALWELDQDIATHASDEARLIATRSMTNNYL